MPDAARADSRAMDHATGTAGDDWRLTGREIHMCYSVASGRGEMRQSLNDHAASRGGLLLALGKDARRPDNTPLAADCGN